MAIWADLKSKILRYAPGVDVTFERLAITPEQVRKFQLPTRPTKKDGNTHAKQFKGKFSVEVEALPVNILQDIVRAAIEQHIDQHQLFVTRTAEESGRGILQNLI